jgi:hypothetical protein
MIDEGTREHFMGSILFKADSTGFTIIDGQQRIASVSLLMAALRELRNANNSPARAEAIAEAYLGHLDSHGHREPRLHLSDHDSPTYTDLVQGNLTVSEVFSIANDPSLSQGRRRLALAYVLLYSLISARVSSASKPLDEMAKIEDAATDMLTFVQITVGQDSNPYLIFETLNERGLTLVISDLAKNFLFAKASTRLSEAENAWSNAVTALGTPDLSRFIRHYWIAKHGLTRKSDLYYRLQETVTSRDLAVEMTLDIAEKARTYSALSDPISTFWTTYPPDVRRRLWELDIYRATQVYPVLLSLLDMAVSPERFSRILDLLTVFTFRYSIIGKGSTGNLEAAYGRSCLAIQAGQIANPTKMFKLLRHLYPPDDEFTSRLSELTIPKSAASLARYILATIELNRSNGYAVDPNAITLEHVIPQKPTPEWIASWPDPSRPLPEYIYRLGNMALLPEKLGRRASRSLFPVKRTNVYSTSPILLTNELAKRRKWGPDQVTTRQRRLAQEAALIWSISL